jgi:hypothetical protein
MILPKIALLISILDKCTDIFEKANLTHSLYPDIESINGLATNQINCLFLHTASINGIFDEICYLVNSDIEILDQFEQEYLYELNHTINEFKKLCDTGGTIAGCVYLVQRKVFIGKVFDSLTTNYPSLKLLVPTEIEIYFFGK